MDKSLQLRAKLMKAHSNVVKREKELLDGIGITPQQLSVLMILGENNAVSTLFIRNKMECNMSDTSRIVDRMVANQLVTKDTDTLDKRKVIVKITHKGTNAMKEGREAVRNLFNGLSSLQVDTLNVVLDKL